MKHLYILIALINCNAQCMALYQRVNPPTKYQNIAASLKELRLALTEHPIQSAGYTSVFAGASVIAWNIHPLACAGLQFFSTLQIIACGTYFVPLQASMRKRVYKTFTFLSIDKEEFDKVAQFASKTCYEETDQHALQEQNTEFLFEALYRYNEYCSYVNGKQEASKYAQAASIFLTHHADKTIIRDIVTNRAHMPHAKRWFEHEATLN